MFALAVLLATATTYSYADVLVNTPSGAEYTLCVSDVPGDLSPCAYPIKDACDLTEVLLAARALEPLLPQPPCPGCLVLTNSMYTPPLTEPQRLRAEADRIESEDAAIARLRRALAACEPGQPEPDDAGDQVNPIQLDPPRKNQQKPVKP